MIKTTLADATKQLATLFDAALRGEEVVIVDDADTSHVVRLVVERAEPVVAGFGGGRGLFKMADDFDAPLPDFDEYQ